jgi:hypothetical protein
MSEEEARRAVELDDFFIILPAFRDLYSDVTYGQEEVVGRSIDKSYVSKDEPCLTKEELLHFLSKSKVL